MELAGRHVLVTGGSRGIGAELSERFAATRSRVTLVARESDHLHALAARIDASAYAADLADPAQVHGLVSRVEADGGPVDLLVNNAGIDMAGGFVARSWADIEALYRVNLLTPVELCHQVLPGMLARGSGHIVNMSSLAGVSTFPGLSVYSSSKAGLSHFTAALRADLRGGPVKTTLVELGPVSTGLLAHAKDYQPVHDSFHRSYQLKILTELDASAVAAEIVTAVSKGRRHVRLPRRTALVTQLVEAPRRATEWLLTGIDHQQRP